jgi:hypothetical protein
MLTTDALLRPVPRLPHRTLPGASASLTFEVMMAATTVAILLRLKLSAEMTSNGRLKPGPDPVGLGSEAHQISPRRTVSAL